MCNNTMVQSYNFGSLREGRLWLSYCAVWMTLVILSQNDIGHSQLKEKNKKEYRQRKTDKQRTSLCLFYLAKSQFPQYLFCLHFKHNTEWNAYLGKEWASLERITITEVAH